MRMGAIVTRIIQQMKRDKRTLALLFFAPLLVLSLMYFIFNSNEATITLVVSDAPTPLIEKLKNADFSIVVDDYFTKKQLQDKEYDGWLEIEPNSSKLTLLNDDPSQSKALTMQLAQILQPSQAAMRSLKTDYVYGDEDTAIFDIFSPMLIGFFVFFFVFLITGIALLKERTSGTLERLLATPIKRSEIVVGYMVGYGLFAFLQTIIIVLFGIYVLDIVHVGSIWLVLLINMVVALVSLSLGALLSSFAASEFQMMQFIPLIIVPQVFFSGIFPLDSMAEWLQSIGRIMPLYYAADALNGVMYKGYAFLDIILNLSILACFAIVFITLNIISLKKYRSL
ncbi:ABC transporter permease [Lysinibacillus fusiformis]|uniref:ABC transporter permease n=1 Tax=Lysinibacillus fusiformis TaxID=28031 RepID=UPI00088C7A2B|nr:ABC transporter permease [Lysinibacillus fusiformis]SCX38218.1 ABC-2 type transport system permease protein [Lysinibacillus fusiformis]SDB05088.1 ABC-2 type transport system permease protein [Lysinibacillus fusiformis]SFH74565.1 ABC-2 type transport system permease protein [Lysinibacillus fusiformis]SFS69580.1 ABC-2 type transport system permease protein [Lysinibacillus fusiformis]